MLQHHRVRPRIPAMACALPNWPRVPARLSDPITRMFIAAVLYSGRPLAEQMGHVDLTDAVDDVAVRDVGGQQGGHEDQRGDDGRPAHDLAPALTSRLRVIAGTARPARAPAAGPARPGRLRGGCRFVTGGRAAGWRPVGTGPADRADADPAQAAGRTVAAEPRTFDRRTTMRRQATARRTGVVRQQRARQDCGCGPSPSWISSWTWRGLIAVPGRDGVPDAQARRIPGRRPAPATRPFCLPASRAAVPFVYRLSKRDWRKLRSKVLTNRCRLWRIWPSPVRRSHGPHAGRGTDGGICRCY